jgi:hypothetical protein
MSGRPDYIPEADECINALTEALTHIQAAVKKLQSAPDAELSAKSTIDRQTADIRTELDALTRRLNDMPTWRPPAG